MAEGNLPRTSRDGREQGFKTPATTKFGGLQLVAGLNPPLIVPFASCPLPSALFNLFVEIMLSINPCVTVKVWNVGYNAWSDALLALYQVEQPSQSFVNNRKQLVESLCP
ncbi:MAG: hypothetical protein AAF316_05340 [Cyanobacteria bacterium P01_A01_bin.80]